MALSIEIPDEIGAALRFPPPEIQRELTLELALALYARWGLSMGLARRMAELSKRDFIAALAERELERHYTADDLEEDQTYAEGRQQ
jgi:predicted HTH domain antitoxin